MRSELLAALTGFLVLLQGKTLPLGSDAGPASSPIGDLRSFLGSDCTQGKQLRIEAWFAKMRLLPHFGGEGTFELIDAKQFRFQGMLFPPISKSFVLEVSASPQCSGSFDGKRAVSVDCNVTNDALVVKLQSGEGPMRVQLRPTGAGTEMVLEVQKLSALGPVTLRLTAKP